MLMSLSSDYNHKPNTHARHPPATSIVKSNKMCTRSLALFAHKMKIHPRPFLGGLPPSHKRANGRLLTGPPRSARPRHTSPSTIYTDLPLRNGGRKRARRLYARVLFDTRSHCAVLGGPTLAREYEKAKSKFPFAPNSRTYRAARTERVRGMR